MGHSQRVALSGLIADLIANAVTLFWQFHDSISERELLSICQLKSSQRKKHK